MSISPEHPDPHCPDCRGTGRVSWSFNGDRNPVRLLNTVPCARCKAREYEAWCPRFERVVDLTTGYRCPDCHGHHPRPAPKAAPVPPGHLSAARQALYRELGERWARAPRFGPDERFLRELLDWVEVLVAVSTRYAAVVQRMHVTIGALRAHLDTALRLSRGHRGSPQ